MKIKCLFGFHMWYFWTKKDNKYRICPKCRKSQMASYDMLYGETIWETTRFHGGTKND